MVPMQGGDGNNWRKKLTNGSQFANFFPLQYYPMHGTQSLAKASIHPCSFAYNQIDLRVSHFISIDKCSLKWPGYVHTWITHDTKLNFPGVRNISVRITYKSTCMYREEWWWVLCIYSLTIGQTLFLHWVLLLIAMMPLCAKIVVWLYASITNVDLWKLSLRASFYNPFAKFVALEKRQPTVLQIP